MVWWPGWQSAWWSLRGCSAGVSPGAGNATQPAHCVVTSALTIKCGGMRAVNGMHSAGALRRGLVLKVMCRTSPLTLREDGANRAHPSDLNRVMTHFCAWRGSYDHKAEILATDISMWGSENTDGGHVRGGDKWQDFEKRSAVTSPDLSLWKS